MKPQLFNPETLELLSEYISSVEWILRTSEQLIQQAQSAWFADDEEDQLEHILLALSSVIDYAESFPVHPIINDIGEIHEGVLRWLNDLKALFQDYYNRLFFRLGQLNSGIYLLYQDRVQIDVAILNWHELFKANGRE